MFEFECPKCRTDVVEKKENYVEFCDCCGEIIKKFKCTGCGEEYTGVWQCQIQDENGKICNNVKFLKEGEN